MANIETTPEIDIKELEDIDVSSLLHRELVVFNDDVNTFDHVIDSLIKVCKHEAVQAEQCTYIVHYQGKCQVKRGDWDTLEPMCTALLDRGITAEIQ